MKMKPFSMLLLVAFYWIPSFSQRDPSLQINEGNVLKYQKIDNRYEGFYVANVSASFRIVNFTYGDFYFEADRKEIISLGRKDKLEERISVKAVGIRSDLFYQMDAFLDAESLLAWPVKDVLLRDPRTSSSRNIGVYGTVGEGLRQAYVPIEYKTNSYDPKAGRLVLKFVASTRLNNVQWKIDGIMDDFKSLRAGRPYYAGQVIVIELPEGIPAGEYTFWIKGLEADETTPMEPKRFKLKV